MKSWPLSGMKGTFPVRIETFGCSDCRTLWLKRDEYTHIGAMPEWEKLTPEEKHEVMTKRWGGIQWVHGPCPACEKKSANSPHVQGEASTATQSDR